MGSVGLAERNGPVGRACGGRGSYTTRTSVDVSFLLLACCESLRVRRRRMSSNFPSCETAARSYIPLVPAPTYRLTLVPARNY